MNSESTSPRVLVAEDDDELRALICERLTADGLHVIELEDGAELGDYFSLVQGSGRVRVPPPDLLLTDVRMPGQSGLEVVRAIRALGLMIPVLVLTAFPDGPVLTDAYALGDTRVLAKPIDLEELSGITRSTLERFLRTQR